MAKSKDDDNQFEYFRNIKRVVGLLTTFWPLMLFTLVVMILKRWSSVMENVLGGNIVDSFASKDQDDFFRHTAILSASYIAYTCLQTIESILVQQISNHIGRTVKIKFYSNLMLDKSQAFFDESKSGELASRLSTDCGAIESHLGSWLPIFATEVFEIGFGVVYMLQTHLKLSGAIAMLLPAMAIATWIQSKWESPLEEKHLELGEEANAKVTEALLHARTVKIFGQQRFEIRAYIRLLELISGISWKLALAKGFCNGFINLSYHLCLMVTFWYGGSLVLSGEITSGQFLSFCLFALSLSDSINCLPDLNSRLTIILTSADRVFSIIENTSEVDTKLARESSIPRSVPSDCLENKQNSTIIPPNTHVVKGHLEFKNVQFAYPSRPEALVLQDFSLIVHPGQSAALIGSSGSGKSTIVCLLTKLYEISSGQILIDGLDLSTLDPNWLRKQIGLVSQEPVLFSGSIRDNICYGISEIDEYGLDSPPFSDPTPEIEQEKIERVAKMAYAHDFITAFPDGYNTLVGERGSLLSVGQRQRISIARALLRDPKILITDEATSALDNTSERIVQQALDRLMEGRTCLVIAHRLSTIRHCYPICYIGKGRVLEMGSHFELLGLQNGHYSKLHTHEVESEQLKTITEFQSREESDTNNGFWSGQPEEHERPLEKAHAPRSRSKQE